MKKFSKKLISFFGLVLVLALMLSLAIPLSRSVADGAGGAGGSTGGNGSNGSSTSGAFQSDDTAGYRMYFAPVSLDKGNPNFRNNVYWELGTFQDIALYETYNWTGGTPAYGRDIYGWHGSYGYGSKILDLGSFSSPFNEFRYSGSLTSIDYRQPIDGSNTFDSFVSLANQTLSGDMKIETILQDYISRVSSYSLSSKQQEELNLLNSYDVSQLMLVFEPVFIACNNSTYNYTISYADYARSDGGNLQAQDTGSKLVNRVPKLQYFTTKFSLDGIEYNPSGSSHWDGFAVFTNWMTGSDSKYSLGFNVNLQYNGGIQRNLLTTDGVSTAISETETAPSQYSNTDSGAGNTNIGDSRYMDALSNWEKLSSDYDANGYAIGRLYMAGWTWNNAMYNGNGSSIPAMSWEGANKNVSVGNIKEAVDSSMKDKITGTVTDYVEGVYGNMTYNNVKSITDNDLYITNNTVMKLDVQSGVDATFQTPYSNTSGLNSLKSKIASQSKAYTLEQPVVAEDEGLAFGSSFRVNFLINNPDISSEIGGNIKEVLTQGGFPITGVSQAVSMDADTTNTGYPKFQDSSKQVHELLSRIQGATAYANAINITGDDKSNSYKTQDGSAITLSVTSMSKKTPVDNYLASASINLEDNGSSATYKFGATGDTYANTHLAQGSTVWYLNSESISTISSAGEDGENFVIVWRNADMKSESDYDLSYTNRDSKARNIATDLATYFTSKNPKGFDEGSTGLITSAFKSVTGATPVGVGYIGTGSEASTSISLGSAFTSSNELTGLSAMVLTVSSESIGYNEAGAGLPAHMLNIVAPSVLGLDSDGSGIRPFSYQKKDYDLDGDWDWASWKVTHSLSGDLNSFAGTNLFYYNDEVGNFGAPSRNPKSFDYDEEAYASYAYNLTRALWGDTPVISNFSGAGAKSTYDSYFETLGFSKGSTGKQTCNVGANVEAQYPKVMHDSFKFTAKVSWDTRKRHKSYTDSDGHHHSSYYSLVPHSSSSSETYNVSHYMNKYTAMDIGEAQVSSDVKNSLYDNNKDTGRSTTFGYYSAISDESENTLTVYPEVNMLMQYARGSLSVSNVDNVYVMGEKARTLKPVALRGIKVDNQQFSGKFTSNTIASDRRAKDLQGSDNLPVVYTGGNINLHTNSVSEKFSLFSYALDLVDESSNGVSIKNGFSSNNSKYKPESEFREFVDSTLNNLGVDITLDITSDKSGNDRLYSYHNFTTMMSNFTEDEDSEVDFPITFRHGEIVTSGSDGNGYKNLISDIANEYGVSSSEARSIFEDSEIEAQLQRAFESSEDGRNKSSEVDEMDGQHWYDEQSTVFRVRKFKTYVTMGDVATSDKLDITLGNDTVKNGGKKTVDDLKGVYDRDKIFSKKAYGKWYMTLYLKNDIDLANGDVASGTSKEILWKEKYIKGADFIVSDATTNDMRN